MPVSAAHALVGELRVDHDHAGPDRLGLPARGHDPRADGERHEPGESERENPAMGRAANLHAIGVPTVAKRLDEKPRDSQRTLRRPPVARRFSVPTLGVLDPWVERKINPRFNPCADVTERHAADDGGMTTYEYLLNAAFVLLVLRQAWERELDRRSVMIPLALMFFVGSQYLHTLPTAGNDLVLIVGLAAVGLTLGVLGGFATHVRAAATVSLLLASAGSPAGFSSSGSALGWRSRSRSGMASSPLSAASASLIRSVRPPGRSRSSRWP